MQSSSQHVEQDGHIALAAQVGLGDTTPTSVIDMKTCGAQTDRLALPLYSVPPLPECSRTNAQYAGDCVARAGYGAVHTRDMPFCCICGCEMRASRRQHHHLAAAPGIPSEFAAAAQAPPTTAKEAPEEAIDGPAPSSIVARIAALRAGAAKRSPNARAPRFGLLLPFVTAESTAIGAAAAAGRALALSTAPSADAASEARVDFAPPPVAPAQPAADTATPGDDGPAVGAVDADSAAADTFSARASADAATEGTADDTASDAPAPSLACWHVAACEVRENASFMLQACTVCRCCHCGLVIVPDLCEQGAGWLCQDRAVSKNYYQASDM